MVILATTLGVLFCIVAYLAICVTIGYVLYRIEMYKMEKEIEKAFKSAYKEDNE